MAFEKSTIPLTTPTSGVVVRYCRPDDIPAIRKLVRVCVVEGAGSPARVSLKKRAKSYPLLFAYLVLILCSLSFNFLPDTVANLALCCMFVDTIYIIGSLYASVAFYINFVSGGFQSDLENPVVHYEMVPAKNSADLNNDYVPSGVKAFWVAESVSSTGKAEIVGTISLDLSSSHKVPGTGELRRMFVSPYHRRLGIGAGLMKVCEGRAKEHGLSTMVLTTTENQPAAINMYERTGYKSYNSRDLPSGWGTIKLIDYGKELVS